MYPKLTNIPTETSALIDALNRAVCENIQLTIDNHALANALVNSDDERQRYQHAAETNHGLWVAAHNELERHACTMTALRYAAAAGNIDLIRQILGGDV